MVIFFLFYHLYCLGSSGCYRPAESCRLHIVLYEFRWWLWMSTRIRITLRAGMMVPGQFPISFIILFYIFLFLSVIFLPLHPASLMHKKMQNKSWHASRSCNFCGGYYGCCLMIHMSFSLCCDLKLKDYILISVYCNTESVVR